MKRAITLILSAVMLCGALTACTNKTGETSEPEQKEVPAAVQAETQNVENKLSFAEHQTNRTALEDAYIELKEAYEDPSVDADPDIEASLNKAAALLNDTDGMTEEQYQTTSMDETNDAILDAEAELKKALETLHPDETQAQ